MVLLGQLEAAEQRLEAERRRNDYLTGQIGWALIRIEQRLAGIEGQLTSRGNGQSPARGLTPAQLAKIATGVALPLLALLLALSGNPDAAKRLLAP